MNKMKKLLSVLLAVLMILSSMTVMASAAKTTYKTVSDLGVLDAYSPYGQVTRLTTEERTSIVFDALDNILAKANINMGEVFNVLGLSVTIDLTSIDRLCYSLDTMEDTFSNGLFSLAAAIINLGVIEEVSFDTWATGMSRDGTAQVTILAELLELLSANKGVVNTILSDGKIDLGIISLGDMSGVEKVIGDIPGMVKNMVFPMLERKDDTLTEIQNLDTWSVGDGNVEITINTFVQNLFVDNRSTTTVKYDADGNMTSEHTGMPIVTTDPTTVAVTATSPRYVYYKDADGKLWTYHIIDAKEAETLNTDDDDENDVTVYTYLKEEIPYELKQEVEGSATYTWQAQDEWGNKWTLKYYNDNSPWLPSLKAAIEAGTVSIDLSSDSVSAGDLLYTFIPYVFGEMAPVVLNGSMKKILGGLFGATYTYVGEVGEDTVTALADYDASATNIFTMEQGEYLWEWSYYEVINGNHYYRFEDQIFKGDLTNTNNYFDIINWEYNIGADFMDEFIPADDSDATNRILLNVNDFLVKVVNTVFVETAETVNNSGIGTDYAYEATWTRPTLTSGSNSYLVENVKAIAQAFIKLAPQHIFGSDYAENDRCYYNLLVSTDNDTVLTGIAAQLVDMIMPSMTLPGASALVASNAKVGSIIAAVIREFAAYLVPEYNYDALIYSDFGTTTADPDKTFVDPEADGLLTSGQTVSGYWLDVCMTMGLDVGYEYIRAFADLGEDVSAYSGLTNTGYGVDGKTYAAGTTQAQLNAQWEGMLDYIVDWALTYTSTSTKTFTGETYTYTDSVTQSLTQTASGCDSVDTYTDSITQSQTKTTGTFTTTMENEWTWKFEKLVNTTGLTIDITTAQDPWVKLDQIIFDLIPFDEILTITPTDCDTKLEQFLRYDLILGIVDLEWDTLINTIQLNGTNKYFRTGNILDQLAALLKDIVNGIFAKVGNTSGNFALIPSVITDFDSLASQANITTLATELVGALYTAGITNNGWDVIAPFLNMFLGWKTDPQVIADPVIWTSFRDNNDYAFQWSGNGVYPNINDGATIIKVLNNSSGMLETHRDSTIEDHSYDINIKSVTSDASVNTLTFTYDSLVSPYETIDIVVGGTYNGDEAVTVVIEYDYVGKDGQAVGGTQYKSLTFFISNLYEDANIDGRWSGDDDGNYQSIDQFKTFQFTEDIYDSVTTFEPVISGTNATLAGTSNFKSVTAPDNSVDMNDQAKKYFSYYQNQDGGWEDSFPKDGSANGLLYYANSGVTEDTEFEFGVYDMGQVAVKYGSDSKVWAIDYIYYDDYDIDVMWADYKDKGITVNDVNTSDSAAVAAYNTYNEALKNVARLATYPMMTTARNTIDGTAYGAGTAENDYVTAIMPQIEDAKLALEEAYTALEEYMANAQGAAGADATVPEYVQNLEAQLALDDGDGEKEVNFQDYEFYEYFNYADLRTAARNLDKAYYAPEIMDTYYILNSGIREAELDNVIANASKEGYNSETLQAAITASRLENDPAAISASIEARNNWTMPTNSKLYVDDLTSRLAYYKQFLTGHEEGTEHLYFLNQEIAHIDAQQLVEADYTEDSWAEFEKRYNDAQEVVAGTAEYSSYNSTIYTAKWHLMVAYKNLLLKSKSLIEAGGTADLLANMAIAEEILGLSLSDIKLSAAGLALADTEEEAKLVALGHLIQGLGYYYVGEDGNTWNLYADSAYEYADNDRPNRSSNQTKVNACNNNLEACIAYFNLNSDPNTIMLKDGAPYEAVIDTTNCGDYNGTIYGIDTLGWDDTLEADGTLADFLTTAYGDDYLEIVVGDAGVETTGTVINVLDEDGAVVESYVFVYFGDVDMDGLVGASDAVYCEYYETYYEGIDTFEQFMAADLDGDGWPGAGDAAYMEYYETYYEGMPEQADVAAAIVDSGLVYEMV